MAVNDQQGGHNLFYRVNETIMYENHYGLTGKPFSIVPNPEMLFLSKNHANALTYLEYGSYRKSGFYLADR